MTTNEKDGPIGFIFPLPSFGLQVWAVVRKVRQNFGRHITTLVLRIGKAGIGVQDTFEIRERAQYGKNETRPFDLMVGARVAFDRAVRALEIETRAGQSNDSRPDWITAPGLVAEFRRIGQLSIARAALGLEEILSNKRDAVRDSKIEALERVLASEGIKADVLRGTEDEVGQILRKPDAYKSINTSQALDPAFIRKQPFAPRPADQGPNAAQIDEAVKGVVSGSVDATAPGPDGRPDRHFSAKSIGDDPDFSLFAEAAAEILRSVFGERISAALPGEVDDIAAAISALVITGVRLGVDPPAGPPDADEVKAAFARALVKIALGKAAVLGK